MTQHVDDSADRTLRAIAARAAAGDDDAFDQLYKRLGGGLRRFLAKRCGQQIDLVEELSQRAWVELWRAFREGRYDPERSAITTYLYALAFKIWMKYGRESRTAPLDDETLQRLLTPSDANAIDELYAAELLDALRDCLSSDNGVNSLLSIERRVLLGLASGKGERTLAAELDIAASTVHSHKQRGLKKIHNCLTAKGFASDQSERSTPPGE